jgi:hypothetical protein
MRLVNPDDIQQDDAEYVTQTGRHAKPRSVEIPGQPTIAQRLANIRARISAGEQVPAFRCGPGDIGADMDPDEVME